MNFKLVSFLICPYVQRAVITLKFKQVPFAIEYIDLKDKPEWFLKLSPLGKVPILIIDGGKEVIFESTVINELLDELNPPVTLSQDPIKKAKERAWIMFADSIFSDLRALLAPLDMDDKLEALMNRLEKLNDVISDSGFFKKEGFSIIDSAYAPAFFRFQYIEAIANSPKFMKLKKVRRWGDNLINQDYVKNSVHVDFEVEFKKYIAQNNPDIKFISNC